MPGDVISRIKVSLDTFHAFRDDRPKEEKWELIDGTPTMMPPPTLIHQRIAANLAHTLNDRLRVAKPEWLAQLSVSVLPVGEKNHNPTPDVTVIDAAIAIGQVYAERFYFVGEVLSENDKPAVLAAKLAYYQAHDPCVGVMFVRQDRIEAELHIRAKVWTAQLLLDPQARIVIPVIGDIARLADLYRRTPLWRPDFGA